MMISLSVFKEKILLPTTSFHPNGILLMNPVFRAERSLWKFSYHAFPKETVAEMEAFTDEPTVDFMDFSSPIVPSSYC